MNKQQRHMELMKETICRGMSSVDTVCWVKCHIAQFVTADPLCYLVVIFAKQHAAIGYFPFENTDFSSYSFLCEVENSTNQVMCCYTVRSCCHWQ